MGVTKEDIEEQVGRLASSEFILPPARTDAVDEIAIAEDLATDNAIQVAGPYFVCLSAKAKRRCLHRVGGCWRRPGVDMPNVIDLGTVLDQKAYTAQCRQCWPGEARPEAAAKSDDSEADSSSSSSSSSEGGVDGAPHGSRSGAHTPVASLALGERDGDEDIQETEKADKCDGDEGIQESDSASSGSVSSPTKRARPDVADLS